MKGARRIMYTGLAFVIVFIWVFVLEGQPLLAIGYSMGFATGAAVVAAAVYWARSKDWQ